MRDRNDTLAASLLLPVVLLAGCPHPRAVAPAEDQSAPEAARPAFTPDGIVPELADVVGGAGLAFLSLHAQETLAANSFVVVPSDADEMYELYEPNAAPFVTSDVLFHAWHILLGDTLQRFEDDVLGARLDAIVEGALAEATRLHDRAPGELRDAARRALLHFAVARALLHPEADVDPALADDVAAVIAALPPIAVPAVRPLAARGLVYSPPGARAAVQSAFAFLSAVPVPFDTAQGAQTAALVAFALTSDPTTRAAYERLVELLRFAGGPADDPSALDVLRECRAELGDDPSLDELARPDRAAVLQSRLWSLPAPSVADQPQSRPGADPSLGRGLRVLPPGVTIRARAFQALGERTIAPSGTHVAWLLGNDSVLLSERDAALLDDLRNEVVALSEALELPGDLPSAGMALLTTLSRRAEGVLPPFMTGAAWGIKTANTQLAAWSELEHDLGMFEKQSGFCLGTYDRDVRFPGYVEPVPAFFTGLADLTRRTRTALIGLGILSTPDGDGSERTEYGDRDPFRESLFSELEQLLIGLAAIATKELADEPLDDLDLALLRDFGLTLKHLALNESNSPAAYLPMSVIAQVARDDGNQTVLQVGAGRPLRIIGLVPWQNGLQWASGAVFSYYEFLRPLAVPLDDVGWKETTRLPLAEQPVAPWLFERGLGVDPESWDADAVRRWLPPPDDYFGMTFLGPPIWRELDGDYTRRLTERIGFASIDDAGLDAVATEFAVGRYDGAVRAALLRQLLRAPTGLRRSAALQALDVVRADLGEPGDQPSGDHRMWIYGALRLLVDQLDGDLQPRIVELGNWLARNGALLEFVLAPDMEDVLAPLVFGFCSGRNAAELSEPPCRDGLARGDVFQYVFPRAAFFTRPWGLELWDNQELRQTADLLVRWPQLELVEIAAYAPPATSPDEAAAVSVGEADDVVEFLVGRGVDAARLRPVGCGPARTEADARDWTRDIGRVEFRLLRTDQGPTHLQGACDESVVPEPSSPPATSPSAPILQP